jgi:hypothetical protein
MFVNKKPVDSRIPESLIQEESVVYDWQYMHLAGDSGQSLFGAFFHVFDANNNQAA